MAMAIPAAEVAEGAASKAGGSVGKKAAASKGAAKKAPANPSKMAAQSNADISTGSSAAKTKANPTGDALALSDNMPSRGEKKSGGEGGGQGGKKQEKFKREPSIVDKQGNAVASKKNVKLKPIAWAWSGNRKLLTLQWIACIVVLGAGTLLAPKGSKDGMPRAMVKGSALSALFLVLALVAAGGKGPAKAATALGTLITAGYVFTSSDVHNVVAWVDSFFNPRGDVSANNPVGTGPPSASTLGSTETETPQAQGADGTAVTSGGTPEGTVDGSGGYTSTTGFGY